MGLFKRFLEEKENLLNEVLITFGKKAYPRFNQIVVLAGGAGSGKGFVQKNLMGIEGKTFDVDALKELSMKSDLANKKFPELKNLKLRNPKDVLRLHDIVSKLGWKDKRSEAFFKSIQENVLKGGGDRKPNIIFDVTLKEFSKLESIYKQVSKLGYNKEDIHLVWVVTDIKVARKQNQERDRVVPEHILLGTHKGAAKVMKDILENPSKIKNMVNGDVWFSFNKAKVDTYLIKREEESKKFAFLSKGKPDLETDKKNKPFYVKSAMLVKVKEKGSKMMNISQFEDKFNLLLHKIQGYVPIKF